MVEPGFVVVGGGSTWGGFGYETSLEEEEYVRTLQADLCNEEVMLLIGRSDFEEDLRRSFPEGRRGVWRQFERDIPRQDLSIGGWKARGAPREVVAAKLIELVREVKRARERRGGAAGASSRADEESTAASTPPSPPADASVSADDAGEDTEGVGLLGMMLRQLQRHVSGRGTLPREDPSSSDTPPKPLPARVKAPLPSPGGGTPSFFPPLPSSFPAAATWSHRGPCDVLSVRVTAVSKMPGEARRTDRPCAPLDEVISVSDTSHIGDSFSPVSVGAGSSARTRATPMTICLQTIPSQASMTSWDVDDYAESPNTAASSRRGGKSGSQRDVFSPPGSGRSSVQATCAEPALAEHNVIAPRASSQAAAPAAVKMASAHHAHVRRVLNNPYPTRGFHPTRYVTFGTGSAHSAAVFNTLSRIAAPRLPTGLSLSQFYTEWQDDAPVPSLSNMDVMDKVDSLAMFAQQGVVAQGFAVANRHYSHVEFGVHLSDGPQQGPLSIGIERGANEAGQHDVLVTVRKYFQLFRLDDGGNPQNLGTVRAEVKLALYGQDQVHLSVQGIASSDADGIAASSC